MKYNIRAIIVENGCEYSQSLAAIHAASEEEAINICREKFSWEIDSIESSAPDFAVYLEAKEDVS